MRVKGFRHSSIFSLALVFFAKREHFSGCIIVEWKELAVGSKCIQDIFADINEEESSWLELLLFGEVVKTCVSKDKKLIWSCILLVDDRCIKL